MLAPPASQTPVIQCVIEIASKEGPDRENNHHAATWVEHHRTRTFQEEYLAFLKAHDVKFEEKYLWDW